MSSSLVEGIENETRDVARMMEAEFVLLACFLGYSGQTASRRVYALHADREQAQQGVRVEK